MKPSSIKIHPISSESAEPASKSEGKARARSERRSSSASLSEASLSKELGQLSVDIYQTDKEIVILAPIAGVTKENVTLSVTDDVLVIKGQRLATGSNDTTKEEIPEENYYTRECFWGNFSRAIVLPEEADSKAISATFDNNVLEIRIPKNKVEHTKIIKIKA